MTSVSYLAELAEQLRASVAAFRLPDQLAEAAGLPQGLEQAPMTSGQLGYPGQPVWGQQPEAFPALPAGPISASYTPQGNAFDIGAYDATWSEAPQTGGFPPLNYDQVGYEQTGFAQSPYGQPGYANEQYPSNPLGNFPFPPER